MTKKKVLIPVLIIGALIGGGLVYKARTGDGEGVKVEITPIEPTKVVQTVSATGKIQPKTSVNISADVSAKIVRLDVKEGDWLEKGALLLQLDSERYQAAVESAEANLRAAQANANLAKENMIKAHKDLVRIEQLHSKDLESEASLDSSRATAEVEKARHQAALDQAEQTKAALKQARDDLSKTTIYAPMSGTISKLNKEVGEIALGSQFQEDVVMVISNLEGMEALVDVDENDIVLISIGDEAEIDVDALPDQTFAGVVTEIANSAKVSASGTTDQKTEFEVKIAVSTPVATLRPGMTASAEIVTEVREQVLGVPIQSVAVRTIEQLGINEPEAAGDEQAPRFEPDREGFVELVWVVVDEVAHARQVTTGIQSENEIEIIAGVNEGEMVVTGGYRAISRDLTDGAPVRSEPAAGNGQASRGQQ